MLLIPFIAHASAIVQWPILSSTEKCVRAEALRSASDVCKTVGVAQLGTLIPRGRMNGVSNG